MSDIKSLLSGYQSVAQMQYINKCDLINKYSVQNVLELPQFHSVAVECNSLAIDNSVVSEEVVKFQIVLLYYFLVLVLPKIYAKNNILFKLKVNDKSKIDYLINYFYLESHVVLKKKIKNKKMSNLNKSINIIKLELDLLTRGLILNKEIGLSFEDVAISNVEKILFSIHVKLTKNFSKKLVGLSSEKFFQNLMYLWAF